MSRTRKDTKKFHMSVSRMQNVILRDTYGIPSWFKQTKKKSRRNKECTALRSSKEIPTFKRSNAWEWW